MRVAVLCCAIAALGPASLDDAPAAPIDHHQHLFGPDIAARASDLSPVTAPDLLKLLDAAGIRRAVVLSVAYQFGNPNQPPVPDEHAKVRAENDWTSRQVARFPDRLRAFCSVNPLKAYALEEIARCARDPQLRRGLKLHFGNSDVDLLNPEHLAQLRRVFRAANSNAMAIVVHLRPSFSRKRPYGATHARKFIDDVLPEALDVPVQIAHLAGAGSYDEPPVHEALDVFADAIAKGDHRMRRIYFDVSGVAGLGEWKGKVHLIAARIRQLGIERILYGSDGSSGDWVPQQAWRTFRELPLSDAEFRTIVANVAPYMR